MSSKLLNMGGLEFQEKFQATDMNLKVFNIRVIVKALGMYHVI